MFQSNSVINKSSSSLRNVRFVLHALKKTGGEQSCLDLKTIKGLSGIGCLQFKTKLLCFEDGTIMQIFTPGITLFSRLRCK